MTRVFISKVLEIMNLKLVMRLIIYLAFRVLLVVIGLLDIKLSLILYILVYSLDRKVIRL